MQARHLECATPAERHHQSQTTEAQAVRGRDARAGRRRGATAHARELSSMPELMRDSRLVAEDSMVNFETASPDRMRQLRIAAMPLHLVVSSVAKGLTAVCHKVRAGGKVNSLWECEPALWDKHAQQDKMRRAVRSRPPTIKGFQHTKDAFSSALFRPRPWHVPHGKLGPRHAHEEKVCVAHSRLEEPSMASKSRGLRCPRAQLAGQSLTLLSPVLLPAHEQNASVTAEPTPLLISVTGLSALFLLSKAILRSGLAAENMPR